MTTSSDKRSHEVSNAIRGMKKVVAKKGVNRESLAAVLAVLNGLAARKDL